MFDGDSGEYVAGLLASALQVLPSVEATSEGSVLRVVTPLSPGLALHSVFETTDCGESGRSFLRLDGCTISNVLNTAACDETQPHAAGLRFVGGNRFGAPELSSDPQLTDSGGDPHLGPTAGSASETFDVSIDCTAAVGPGLYGFEVRLGKALQPVPTRRGHLYVQGAVLMRTFASHAQSVESWFAPPGSPVPADPALVGLTFHVQGFCGGMPPAGRLSNVLTQTIR